MNVDPRRIYAFGGSMGGQETLLLVARFPRLLAGAAAFDPATDMSRRYRDFASLKGGRELQRLAREEIGGTPRTDPRAYELRSPDHYVEQLARSGVPLQLYWSFRDKVITDQREETGALADDIREAESARAALGLRRRLGAHGGDAARPAPAARAGAVPSAAVVRGSAPAGA